MKDIWIGFLFWIVITSGLMSAWRFIVSIVNQDAIEALASSAIISLLITIYVWLDLKASEKP